MLLLTRRGGGGSNHGVSRTPNQTIGQSSQWTEVIKAGFANQPLHNFFQLLFSSKFFLSRSLLRCDTILSEPAAIIKSSFFVRRTFSQLRTSLIPASQASLSSYESRPASPSSLNLTVLHPFLCFRATLLSRHYSLHRVGSANLLKDGSSYYGNAPSSPNPVLFRQPTVKGCHRGRGAPSLQSAPSSWPQP